MYGYAFIYYTNITTRGPICNTVVIILQLYNVIYKSKQISSVGKFRNSATILNFWYNFCQKSLSIFLISS